MINEIHILDEKLVQQTLIKNVTLATNQNKLRLSTKILKINSNKNEIK